MKRKNYKSLFSYLILILLTFLYAFPIIIMLCTSFKTYDQAFDPKVGLLPVEFYLGNFKAVFETIPFFHYLNNTMYITVMNVAATLLVTPMIAYSLAKVRWKGRNIVFSIIISTLLIPYAVTMIPIYKMWVKLGLIGTYAPLIIPAFFGYPFYIILLRQFMLTIPDELLEAAKIDGCGSFARYVRIALPLSKPGLATILIFSFLFTFSDFLGPLLYTNKASDYTLSLGLQSFLNEHSVEWTSLMAAVTLFMTPVIIMFVFAQKYLIEGISTSGLKS